MNKLPDPLTKEEEVELKELSRKIFGKSIFVTIEKEDREKPEYKRYEEIIKKKMAFLAAKNKVRAQMMWN